MRRDHVSHASFLQLIETAAPFKRVLANGKRLTTLIWQVLFTDTVGIHAPVLQHFCLGIANLLRRLLLILIEPFFLDLHQVSVKWLVLVGRADDRAHFVAYV